MITVKVTFQANNATFRDDPSTESARILREAANWVKSHGEPGQSHNLFDINGNTVGQVSICETR